MFDTKTATWQRLSINGAGPSARSYFAVAQLDHRVFIHGGYNPWNHHLSDFFMLDLKKMEWIKIENSGIEHGLRYHSLTPVSYSQLFRVGGHLDRSPWISNRIAMFDIAKFEWENEAILPGLGSRGRLQKQQTFEVRNETVLTVICIGGFVDGNWKKHPNHMNIFEFPITN